MVCPISLERIDTHALRISGGILFIFTLLYLTQNSLVWLVPVTVELAIRAIFSAKYAPIFILARTIMKALNLSPHLEDAAPKRFAVRIGLLMTAFIIMSTLLGAEKLGIAIGMILLLCIGLEVLIGFCVGCVMYGWWVKCKG